MNFKLIAIVLSLIFLPLDKTFGDAAKPNTNDRVIGINDAFIPSGFDSSSDAFMVVSGIFPNSCYGMKEVKVSHVGPTLHQIAMWATVNEGMCMMVLVPFSKEVQLGRLAIGEHQIKFENGDGTFWQRNLTISD